MEDKLKPCPFCGSEAKLFTREMSAAIYCVGCGIRLEISAHSSYCAKDKVIEMWNKGAGRINSDNGRKSED